MRLRRHLLVIAAYLVLTLVFTYPLITQFSTHVIGGGKLDNYEYVWKMWWIPHALTSGIDPFFIPTIYYPYGYSLAYGEITPAHTFLMLPITLALGEVVAYNLAVIGSTVLTGWITFVLARRWFSRLTDAPDERLVTLAAFFAGAAFAFCVSRQLKLTGHLPLFDTQWLALALLGFDLWLERRSLRAALLTAIALSLAALSSWYFAFMLALLLPVYLLAYGVNWRQFLTDRRSWAALGVIRGRRHHQRAVPDPLSAAEHRGRNVRPGRLGGVLGSQPDRLRHAEPAPPAVGIGGQPGDLALPVADDHRVRDLDWLGGAAARHVRRAGDGAGIGGRSSG
ncbi:MAG: hypothetical protein U0521_17270 [Anaerolineae bacterium]